MSNITTISASALKVHPRNTEFFDDIQGEEYERFKTSIQEDGVITPLIVSNDMTIISGHQRLKACLDLDIKTVPVMIREDLDNENEKLKVLLAANFGRSKNDETKQRKVAVQYVELCGLRNGQQSKLVDNRLPLKEIAQQLGTSETSLKELLLIERKLTPELKEILDAGGITKTTASKILVKLSPEDQQALLSDLGKEQLAEMSAKQIQEYINKIQGLENQIKGYEMKLESRNTETTDMAAQAQALSDLEAQLKEKEIEIESLKSQEPKAVMVVPDDYESLKKLNAERLQQVREFSERAEQAERKLQENKSLQKNKTDLNIKNTLGEKAFDVIRGEVVECVEAIEKNIDFLENFAHKCEYDEKSRSKIYWLLSDHLTRLRELYDYFEDVIPILPQMKVDIPTQPLITSEMVADGEALLREAQATVNEPMPPKKKSEVTANLENLIAKRKAGKAG